MKRIQRVIAGMLALILALCAPDVPETAHAASKTPGIDASVTTKNVQSLLKAYDADSAYIMQKQIEAGDDILMWFASGKRIIDGIDTAVHEETHGYSFRYAGHYNATAYFIGKKKTVYVSHTKVYPTREMAGTIPKQLRTFRYNTYVAKPIPNLASDIQGAYGLLNEFMAYRSGMHVMISLFPYLKSQNADGNAWMQYIISCENNRQAYAEFKYYILHYLRYAKKRYPDVYQGIAGNRSFCRAYQALEGSYAKLIRTYEKDLKRLKRIAKQQGYEMEVTKEHILFIGRDGRGSGFGRFTAEYEKLKKETEKGMYASIHRQLVRNGTHGKAKL